MTRQPAPPVQHLDASPCSQTRADLGESARWDARRRELLWVDITGRHLHRGRVSGTEVETVRTYTTDDTLTVATPLADGSGWIIGLGATLAFLAEDGTTRQLAAPEADKDVATRMNDGACDAMGRLWIGSMALDQRDGAGSLYRIDLDGTVARVLDHVGISNGIGWSPDATTMYWIDSKASTVFAIDYGIDDGELGEHRSLVVIDEGGPVPDGLTVDVDGHVWVGIFGAGEVRRYDPAGTHEITVHLPASQGPDPCFAGDDGRTLVVTSVRHGLSPAQLREQPDAGRLCSVMTGFSGPPVQPYRGPLQLTLQR